MARSWWHRLYLVVCFAVTGSLFAFAQGTPLNLGPLTVNVPPGWKSNQLGNGQIQLYSPDSTPQQYFQVEFLPFEQTSMDVRQRHNTIIGNLSGMMRPGSTPQSGVTGKFIWTRVELQRAPGDIIISVLYSAKAGSVYIPISVESSPAIFSRNIPSVEAMVRNATLADSSQGPAAPGTGTNPGGSQGAPPAGAAASLSDYVYAVPPGWTSTPYPDGIVLMSPLSVTNERCVVTISPMRRPSGNLLGDAFSIFQDVYKSYERRNQTNRGTPMPESVVRGTSGQGWDYVIVKKGIAPPGSRESRLGFVFVAQLNNRLAVISGVSKDPLVSTCFGEVLNNAWPKFFYSLNFKGWTPTDQSAAMRKRISGEWMSGGATAAAAFTFAGNGRYLDAAGRQTYERINSSEVLATTTAFAGNGAYSLRGNSITLTPDNHNRPPEPGFIRVEEESKDDGRSWTDVLYLLRTSTVDGKEYELRMKKTRQ